jgi:CHAD domain-containing protein
MSPEPVEFTLSHDADAASTFACIRTRLLGELEPVLTLRRRFLDSFEWSLYLSGAALEERSVEQGRELIWLDLGNQGAVIARQIIDADPGFAGELPQGPVRQLLTPALGICRLLPMVEIDTQAQTLRVLNEDDKTVARIVIEHNRLVDAGPGRQTALQPRLMLLPVRGYDAELAATAAVLTELLTPEPAHAPLVLEAYAASGCSPGAYSSQLDYRLDPQQRADAAAKGILLDLLDTLEANVDGTRRNLDSEFLHDLRVATRRTRSALSQIKGVFAPGVVEDYKTGFAWVQQVTGPVRDLDVHLLDFAQLRERLPPAMRDDLDPLRDWLAAHYDGEQQRLVDALDSPRFASLLVDWRAFLEAPLPGATAEPNAALPIKALADQCIWRMFKRVRDEGRGITDASPAEDLHELRKSCKNLRYLMEFFQSLYPDDEMRALIKQTKVLLDNLGGFQDLAVQAEHLREIAERMQAEGAVEARALLAMGALMSNLFDAQQRARQEFAQIFALFDTKANGQLFRRLFNRGVNRGARASSTGRSSSPAIQGTAELAAEGAAR